MHKSNPTFLETGSEEIRLTFEFFTLQDAYPIFTKFLFEFDISCGSEPNIDY